MRVGITIIGNVILIFGIVFFFIAAMQVAVLQNEIDHNETDVGKLARALDPDVEEQYQEHLDNKEDAEGRQGLGILISLVGLGVLIAGYVLKPKK